MCFLVCGQPSRMKTRTRDRFQPRVLVKVQLRSTSANGVIAYNNDYQLNHL
jgi:hypothetical protein